MGIFDEIATWARKPASMAAGVHIGLQKLLDSSLDPQRAQRYGNPLSGLIEGAKHDISITQGNRDLQGKYDPLSGGAKWIGAGIDTAADPTLYLGGLGGGIKALEGGALGGRIGSAVAASKGVEKAMPFLEAAGKITPLKGAPIGEKAAQLGRRLVTGTALTGHPLMGLGYATMAEPIAGRIAATEAVSKLLAKAPKVGRVATTTAEDLGEEAGQAIQAASAPRTLNKRRIPANPEAIAAREATNAARETSEFQAALDRVMGGGPTATQDASFAANIDRMAGAPNVTAAPPVPTNADINEVLGGLVGEPTLGSPRLAQPVPTVNPNLPPLTLEDLLKDPSIAHYRGAVKQNAARKLLALLEGAA